ncbi:hypothetical protein SUGI_1009580 [Cryptomeria japonica]|nr:hypothetical protein SUGI_1009580 [Cryptomeria japonica]
MGCQVCLDWMDRATIHMDGIVASQPHQRESFHRNGTTVYQADINRIMLIIITTGSSGQASGTETMQKQKNGNLLIQSPAKDLAVQLKKSGLNASLNLAGFALGIGMPTLKILLATDVKLTNMGQRQFLIRNLNQRTTEKTERGH